MRLIYLFLIVCCVSSSCGSSTTSAQYQDPHLQEHSKMHEALYREEHQKKLNKQIENFTGKYKGTLPCADGEKIILELELLKNFAYRSTLIQTGKPESRKEATGKFNIEESNLIQVKPAVEGISLLIKEGSDLRAMDENGKKMSAMSEHYLLRLVEKRNSYVSDHPKASWYVAQWNKGVMFYATGNEPEWSLNLTRTDSLQFYTSNGIDFSGMYSSLPSPDLKTNIYRSIAKNKTLTMQLVEMPCKENTSGNTMHHAINISIKLNDKDGKADFTGCGDFVPDPGLSGNWLVKSLSGKSIDLASFNGKQPLLIMDLYNQTLAGSDGCNSFHGRVAIKKDKLVFGPVATTLMACPNMEESANVLRVITEKKLTYVLGGNLRLLDGEHEVMVLEQSD